MSQNHPTAKIHPTAIIEPGAYIGKNVHVGPYSVISGTASLEDDVVIKSHVCVDGHTKIGKGTTVWPGAVIGAKTQDLKYRGEKTFVEIGEKCEIRECVTINSSCGEGTCVLVGNGCLIMAYCHIAHNCVIGNQVIMANNTMLAGHVTIEDCAVIGGLSGVHQFSRIGCYAMVGGMSRVVCDVPPYTIGAGIPYKIGGLNLIGLKRRGFSLKTRNLLRQAYRFVYREGLTLEAALLRIEQELEGIPEVLHWVDFCRGSKRGLIDMQGMLADSQARSDECEDSEELEDAQLV
ncbi:MAG: acyl-ACP--UDP-N-acetylglucosamine O-acyltransferase [Verrucomicrobia bacterium]|nr:acyl-ACP--UDP-N-acetylglucosamine O-acyltransferase [Verrucomicrobiota bacterium]